MDEACLEALKEALVQIETIASWHVTNDEDSGAVVFRRIEMIARQALDQVAQDGERQEV